MKVRELQQRLSKLDPELDVLCYTEDTKLVAGNTGFRLLEIEDVNITQGERVRLDDGTPYLKIGCRTCIGDSCYFRSHSGFLELGVPFQLEPLRFKCGACHATPPSERGPATTERVGLN